MCVVSRLVGCVRVVGVCIRVSAQMRGRRQFFYGGVWEDVGRTRGELRGFCVEVSFFMKRIFITLI